MGMCTVEDVEKIMKVEYSTAAEIVRNLNIELKRKGFYVVRGRVSRVYLEEKHGLLGTKKAPVPTTDAKEKITTK